MTAVLDWDLASIGPPEMDLGWHFGLEFMMESLFGRSVPGFPGPAEALARYERRAATTVREDELHWHEVFALVRALAINDRHQRITGDRRRARQPDGCDPPGAAGGGRRDRRGLLLGSVAAAPMRAEGRGGLPEGGHRRGPRCGRRRQGGGSRSEKPMTPAFDTS